MSNSLCHTTSKPIMTNHAAINGIDQLEHSNPYGLPSAPALEKYGSCNKFVVELHAEDYVNDGAFVLVGALAEAIARAKGSANLSDATRKMFSIVNGGVQLKKLSPLEPENLKPLSVDDFGHGVIPFKDLAEWGQSLPARIDFKLAESKHDAVDDQKAPVPLTDLEKLAPKEPVAQRRERHLELFEAEKRHGERGALARAARAAGVDRSNMKKDIDKAIAARKEKTRAGTGWTTQLVKGGKRGG
jgi:hypothetical protein